MEKIIHPPTWFSERELLYKPIHFVQTQTEITNESKLWIYNNLQGRFCIVKQSLGQEDPLLIFELFGYPAFEDPKEAVLYELTWA